MKLELVTIILCVLMTGIFAGMETGGYMINRVRLRHRVRQGLRAAAALERNLKDPKVFIFTTLVCQNFFVYVASSTVTELYLQSGLCGEEPELLWNFLPWSAEVAATFTLMLPLFLFGEIGPKNLFLHRADLLMYQLPTLQRLCAVLCYPVTLPLKALASLLMPREKNLSQELMQISSRELMFHIAEGHRGGLLSARQNSMINNVLAIQSAPLAQLYTAPGQIPSLPLDASPADCLGFFRQNPLVNQVPLHRGAKGDIAGTVRFFDVIAAAESGEGLGPHVRPLFPLSSAMTLQEAFYVMQSQKEDIAAVKGPSGAVEGVLRLRDILRWLAGCQR